MGRGWSVEMADRGANVDIFDKVRIKRVIRFAETTVGEAMIPVAEMTALNRNRDTRSAITLVIFMSSEGECTSRS